MRNILVTGAAGGMGISTCSLLLKNGYNVFAIDVKETSPELEKVQTEISSEAKLSYFSCDVTDINSVTNVFNQIKEKTSSLDGIVHTAGIYNLDSLVEISEESFVKIFNINLFGVYRINKTFLPLLKTGSRVVITSSELAPLDPLPFTGIYAITKAALEKYAYSLRMELNLLGIKVSVIRPGAVKTSLLNVSTVALNKFVEKTKLYNCNSIKFKKIVDSIEAKNISPDKIASTINKALTARKPKFVYKINRNFLLLLLNALPDRFQVWIIKQILK